jgi:hypothetical protein
MKHGEDRGRPPTRQKLPGGQRLPLVRLATLELNY